MKISIIGHICIRIFKFIKSCGVCQVAKGVSLNTRLYTPISIPKKPWTNISMDFVLGLPKTLRGYDSIFVVVDRFFKMTHFIPCKKAYDVAQVAEFSKMAHFIPCKKTFDYVQVANIFFKEIVRLHGLLRSIISNRDSKFVGYF